MEKTKKVEEEDAKKAKKPTRASVIKNRKPQPKKKNAKY